MVNKKKVFWLAFAISWAAFVIFGASRYRFSAYPSSKEYSGFLTFAAFWAALVACVPVALTVFFEKRRQILVGAIHKLQSIGNWFLR